MARRVVDESIQTGKVVQHTIRIPESLYKKLLRVATLNRRTISSEIQVQLESKPEFAPEPEQS